MTNKLIIHAHRLRDRNMGDASNLGDRVRVIQSAPFARGLVVIWYRLVSRHLFCGQVVIVHRQRIVLGTATSIAAAA